MLNSSEEILKGNYNCIWGIYYYLSKSNSLDNQANPNENVQTIYTSKFVQNQQSQELPYNSQDL